jgi:hypothetical protein
VQHCGWSAGAFARVTGCRSVAISAFNWAISRSAIDPNGTTRLFDPNRSSGCWTRTSEQSTPEHLENKPNGADVGRGDSSPLATVRDRSIPPDTSPTTDSDIESAIVKAVSAGAFDVARALAALLESRQRAKVPANVVPIRREGGPR